MTVNEQVYYISYLDIVSKDRDARVTVVPMLDKLLFRVNDLQQSFGVTFLAGSERDHFKLLGHFL